MAAAAGSSRRPSRRQFLLEVLRVGTAGAAAGATTSVMGSLISRDDHEQEVDMQSILEAPSSCSQGHAEQRQLEHRPRQQMQHQMVQAPARPTSSAGTCGGARPAAPARQVPKAPQTLLRHPPARPHVLQLQNIAELEHLRACHPQRLLVIHCATAGCPLGDTFLPVLADACRRYPAALFLRIVLQPEQAAQAVSQQALQGLRIGRLPCTLLLRGPQRLACIQVGAASSSREREQPPAEVAMQAARRLHAAARSAAGLLPAAAEEEQLLQHVPVAAPCFDFAVAAA